MKTRAKRTRRRRIVDFHDLAVTVVPAEGAESADEVYEALADAFLRWRRRQREGADRPDGRQE